MLEEKEIDPVRTVPVAVRKWRYRRTSPVPPGAARPVFVVGVQRSGTNMLLRGLGNAPEVEVHNENDRRAFERYKLRGPHTVAGLVDRSRHSHVLFKPLCDSHRTDELLALRDPDAGHGRSGPTATSTAGSAPRSPSSATATGRCCGEFAAGVNTSRWHVQRISPESAAFVRSFDYDTMTAESGAALMWLIRNRLFFDLGLDRRADVHLVSYNSFLADPGVDDARVVPVPRAAVHPGPRRPRVGAPADAFAAAGHRPAHPRGLRRARRPTGQRRRPRARSSRWSGTDSATR